jgi:hypothetical protein
MDWVNRMNAVIDYVEKHLCDEISPDEVSRIIASPYSVFQRSLKDESFPAESIPKQSIKTG